MSLMLGVSGIRGIIGETMTLHVAADVAAAFAAHLGGARGVVLGRDSRVSGVMLAGTISVALRDAGCDVIDLGVVTTPAIGLMVRRLSADGGVMVTASHNPEEWNGIKFLTRDGRAPSDDEARRILRRFTQRDFVLGDVDARTRGERTTDDTAARRHVDVVLAVVDVEAIRERSYRVVLDSVNGAGGPSGRMLLEELGCEVAHVNGEPTGEFAHGPEPTAENLTSLTAVVRDEEAAIGFAQDPDADRLAVVDETGRYIGEEYTLAIAVREVLRGASARADAPGSGDGAWVVTNLSTSRMIDDLVAGAGPPWQVHRTPVGEANVVQGMLARDAVIGGEGNGGVIDPRVGLVRDSLVAMALTLAHMAGTRLALSQVVAQMPAYRMLKSKLACDRGEIAARLDRVRTAFSDQRVRTEDGVRVDWSEGWVHVRASNTEPVMRVISEAADEDAARALVQRVQAVMG